MEEVLEKLKELQIEYDIVEHIPVQTIEEMEHLGPEYFKGAHICKNLFLRDAKGKRHFLVIIGQDKKADIKSIEAQIGCTRLSFASPERLDKYLKLQKGSVTPFGLINDVEKQVEVVIDRDLMNKNKLGFHPNINTATVLISFKDLEKFLKEQKNKVTYIKV